MRAAVLTAVGGSHVVAEDVELAPTTSGLVRVRILATGVCHSDLSLANGSLAQRLPAVLGHESCGEVVEVGPDVTRVQPGTRVVLSWTPACRECRACLRGEAHLCQRSAAMQDAAPYATWRGEELRPGLGVAGFAEETLVVEQACVPVSAEADPEIAALVGCAVATGHGAIVRSAQVQAGEVVLVAGLGAVGLAGVMAAIASGASVLAVDPSAERREAAAALGAIQVLAPDEDVVKAARQATGGDGVDVAIDAVGRSAVLTSCWKATRRGGRVVVVGAGRHDDKVSFSALELFFQARSLLGCYYGATDPERDLPALVDACARGELPAASLVTHRTGLDGVDEAFARMLRGEGLRTVVLP